MKPSPSTLWPTPSAASAAVPKRDVYRVSHMYTTESRTPASESGAPTRNTVGRARQSGASRRIRPRRQAMPIPMRNPPPRTITEARAAPSTPSFGNGPTPLMSSGSRPTDSTTEAMSRRNGVRVSPEARNVASIAKKPNTSGPPRSHVSRYARPSVATSCGTPITWNSESVSVNPRSDTTVPAARAYTTAAPAARAAASGSPSPWRRAATAISPTSTISPSDSSTHT